MRQKKKGVAPLAASLCVGLAASVAATGVSAQENGTKYEYPKARVCDQVDEYFGTKVADPYRWMEIEKTPELEEWIAAENKTTNAYLDQISFRDELRREMTERYDYAKQGTPWKRGGRYFYSKNTGLQNQSTQHFKTSLDGEEKLLIDPNALSDDGTVALSSLAISKDGRYMAYSVSVSGSDWREIYVQEIESGKKLDDCVRWAKFTGIA
jgi:prolyl oligopeptidase